MKEGPKVESCFYGGGSFVQELRLESREPRSLCRRTIDTLTAEGHVKKKTCSFEETKRSL